MKILPYQKEAAQQKSLIKWFKLQFPNYEMLLFHIPNGGTRNAGEAANLKLQGVRAGVPDLFFAKASGPFHGLFIEMKSEKGKIRDSQRCMMALFEEQDYHAAVCYSWEEAKDKILWYLSLNDQPSSTLEGRIFP